MVLVDIGVYYVLIYVLMYDFGCVLVMIGVCSCELIVELFCLWVFFDWFDVMGVDDILVVFVGEIVD